MAQKIAQGTILNQKEKHKIKYMAGAQPQKGIYVYILKIGKYIQNIIAA